MRAGGGKNKGSGFERGICKDLSLWISKGKKEDIFWRSAMSGGRSTVAMKQNKKLSAQAGDISAVHKRGHIFVEQFMVECKFYKTLNYDSLIRGKGKLLDFWQKARTEAARYNKEPILVAKQNNWPIVACLTGKACSQIGINSPMMILPGYDLYMIIWGDFLELNPKNLKGRKNARPKRRSRVYL